MTSDDSRGALKHTINEILKETGGNWASVRLLLAEAVAEEQRREEDDLLDFFEKLDCLDGEEFKTFLRAFLNERPYAIKWRDERGAALNFACTKRSGVADDVDFMRWVVELYPEAASFLGEDDYTPLHYFCNQEGINHDVLKLLYQASPDALNEETSRGELPLHLALCHKQSMEVIVFLVSKGNPDNVMPWSSAFNPLSLACRGRQSVETIDFLLEKCGRDALMAKDKYNDIPVYVACRKGYPLQVIQRLWPDKMEKNLLPLQNALTYENQALEVVEYLCYKGGRVAVVDRGGFGRNALHVACRARQSFEIIKFLLMKGGPKQLDVEDPYGCRPFDDACSAGHSLEVLQLLALNFGNQCVLQATRNDRLPLHWACDAEDAPTLDVIEWLVQMYPKAVYARDHLGQLPLHIACLNGCSLEVIQFLIGESGIDCVRETTDVDDDDGQLPLHCACHADHPNLDVIKYLVHIFPESMQIETSDEELPIDIIRQRRDNEGYEDETVLRWMEDFEREREKLSLVYKIVRDLGKRRVLGSEKLGFVNVAPGEAFAKLEVLSEKWGRFDECICASCVEQDGKLVAHPEVTSTIP